MELKGTNKAKKEDLDSIPIVKNVKIKQKLGGGTFGNALPINVFLTFF